MKKSIVLLAVFLMSMASLVAQDVITLKNGDEVKAKVQEIGLTDVKYKKFENPDGPTYTLLKGEIFMIKYENGEKDVFRDEVVVPPAEVPRKEVPAVAVAPAAVASAAETLKIEEAFWGFRVVNDRGRRLNGNEINSLLSEIPEAISLYRAGKQQALIGEICYSVGSFLIGWELGTMLSFPEMTSYTTMTVGVGATVFGFIYYYSGYGKLKRAMTIYNGAKTGRSATSLNFGVTSSGGIGLTYNF
jgi:hypothetical protein